MATPPPARPRLHGCIPRIRSLRAGPREQQRSRGVEHGGPGSGTRSLRELLSRL